GSRRDARDHSQAMTTINSKILIGRQDQGIRKGLRHPHEASVGEARGNIGILLHQLLDRTQVFAKLEGNAQGGAPKQSAETWSARLSKKVVRLGQHRFAGGPRWRRAAHLVHLRSGAVRGVPPSWT